MSAPIEAWGSAPTTPEAPAVHTEGEDCGGTCAACVVKDAGARVLADASGIDYDTEPEVSKAHLRHIASHIYSAMSEAILDLPGIKSLSTAVLNTDGSVETVDPT
jgi:hypothetical protein